MLHHLITKNDYNNLSKHMQETIQNSTSILRVKYSDPDFPTLHITEKGNWIDLKCSQDYTLKAGESTLIDLGVAMKLPEDFEAWLVPRSGTFKKYGLTQTNGIGIIDNSYSGNGDIWKMPVLAHQDTFVAKGERLCQFRLMPTMDAMITGGKPMLSIKPGLVIVEVSQLDDVDRGGFGSSGR